MIIMMNVLHACPLSGIAGRRAIPGAQIGPPLRLVTSEKSARIECAQGIATDALLVFQNETQVGLISQIGADEDSAQRVGVFPVKGFAVLAIVSRFQADVVSSGLVARPSWANGAIIHSAEIVECLVLSVVCMAWMCLARSS